ncbi:MAG: RNA polymerase sigma-70 factor [Cytophagales bacterium]|nr:RNA polymerase sigma-70 factor [Cytophagales bacterium]
MLGFEECSEDNLINLLKKGNQQAFKAIFERKWTDLYLPAYRLLMDKDLAKDAVQEVFFDLWNRRKKLDVSNLSAYLYKAVRFQSLKQLRKANLQNIHEERFKSILSHNSSDDLLNLNMLQESLDKSLNELPEKYQKVFNLSRIQQLSNKEIAEQLQLSPRTVEWYLHTTLKHLKTTLTLSLVLVFSML